MERRKFVWNGLLFTASLGLGACQHEYREEPYGRPIRRRGPPPHAPAHGYRHRYRRGLDLVFDSGLDVYLVAGARRTYFYDGRFYRLRGGNWEVSRDYDGSWRNSSGRRLPLALRRAAGKWNRKRRRRDRDRDCYDDHNRRRRCGPPPHAAAHGYRHRYRRGLDLKFDSGLGVYLVVGALRAFYYDGSFYRFKAGDWWVSPDYHKGPWRKSSGRRLPLALRRSVRKGKRKEERRDEGERGRGRRRRDGY
jgi:hypothetical protein